MTQFPADGALSQYFKTVEAMTTWLHEGLGGLDTTKLGTKHIAALPYAYRMDFDQGHYDRLVAGQDVSCKDGISRDRFIPVQYEVSSDSEMASLCSLAQSVLDTFNKGQGRYSVIYVHQEKPGQAPVMREPHYRISGRDPLHNHADTAQIDFRIVELDHETKKIITRPFTGNHIHLINGQLIR